MPRQRRQHAGLGRAGEFVTDMDVGNAGAHEGQGFAGLLAADAYGAPRHLGQRNVGTLVGLGMRPKADAGAVRQRLHAVDVALEDIEVKNQRRGIDIGESLAGLGGRWKVEVDAGVRSERHGGRPGNGVTGHSIRTGPACRGGFR